MMDKKLLKELQLKLKQEKASIEKELESFAKKDPKLKSDWDSRFPKYNGGTGGEILEEAADEVEEYSTRLPIEYSLELRLKDINSALEKIEGKKYGICEKCGKKISTERLKVCPEAKFCIKCEKK
jgi:RNA polymerase-binding transcription factor DksA